MDNGGPVVASPVIVTVTWSPDSNAATYDAWVTRSAHRRTGATSTASTASAPWQRLRQSHQHHRSAPGLHRRHRTSTAGSSQRGVDWPATRRTRCSRSICPPGPSQAGLTTSAARTCASRASAATTPSRGTRTTSTRSCPTARAPAGRHRAGASHELNEMATDPHPAQTRRRSGSTTITSRSSSSRASGTSWATPAKSSPAYGHHGLHALHGAAPVVEQERGRGQPGACPRCPSRSTTRRSCPRRTRHHQRRPRRLFGHGPADEQGHPDGAQHDAHDPHRPVQRPATSGPFTIDIRASTSPSRQDMNGNTVNNGTATVTLDQTSGDNGRSRTSRSPRRRTVRSA